MTTLSFVLPTLLTFASAFSGLANHTGAAPGRVGGPGHIDTSVEANDTDAYEIQFRGGEPAIIVVRGDGDTDIDVRVYDESGNLVACDVDDTDQCVVRWTPRWTGKFRVQVQNLGDVYNRYRMETN